MWALEMLGRRVSGEEKDTHSGDNDLDENVMNYGDLNGIFSLRKKDL